MEYSVSCGGFLSCHINLMFLCICCQWEMLMFWASMAFVVDYFCWWTVVCNGGNWCLQPLLFCWWQYKACTQCSRSSGQKNRAQHSLRQWTVGSWVALAVVCQELLNHAHCLFTQKPALLLINTLNLHNLGFCLSLCVKEYEDTLHLFIFLY